MADDPLPIVQPEEAIAHFRGKGLAIAFDWRDVWQDENLRAFTVAKAMSRDLLEDIREAVDRALTEGLTLKQFADELRPRLVRRGWWGRKRMVDPATGEDRVVQLGSPARLRTIYRTNLRTAYMKGRWERIERTKAVFPLLRYVSVKDGRERDEHGAWHDTVLPVDDPWWDTHFPPCGWNCRCDAQALNERMLAKRGLTVGDPQRFPERDYVNKRTGEVVKLERGIDPGWSYNVGKAPLDGLTPAPRIGLGGGSEDALQASLQEGDYERLRGFFEPFGIRDRRAAIAGRVVIDAAGWPLPISAGLFRGVDGAIRPLPPGEETTLATAAETLLDPVSIGWQWIVGEDGRALLVRRYVGRGGLVDIGRTFWRWRSGRGHVRRGRLVWTREEGELAGFDPRQPRDADGKWRRTSRGPRAMDRDAATGFTRSALDGEQGEIRHDLEPVSDRAARKLEALGLQADDNKGARKMVALDRSLVRHVQLEHGKDSRGQLPPSVDDFLDLPSLLVRGRMNHGTPRIGRNGAPNVFVTDGKLEAVFEVRKHTVVPKSVRKKK